MRRRLQNPIRLGVVLEEHQRAILWTVQGQQGRTSTSQAMRHLIEGIDNDARKAFEKAGKSSPEELRGPTRTTILLEANHVRIIDQLASDSGMASRSAVVRSLIDSARASGAV